MPDDDRPRDGQDDAGTPAERPRRRWWRLAAVVVGGVCVVVVAAGVMVAGILWRGARQVGQVDVDLPTDVAEAGQDPGPLDGRLNVLVVGSDSRAGLSDEQLLTLGTERVGGSRTDTIMLVQVRPDPRRVAVLSFPRDLLVTRCDGTRGRINAAYEIGEEDDVGGPTCLLETVTDLTGVSIDHFVKVDLAGFIDVVDALGGVSLYLAEPLRDVDAGVDLPAGCVELDGNEALGFVRARKIDSDFGRIARQQRFLGEVVDKASSLGTILNLPRLYALVDAASQAVETDQELSVGQMRRLAAHLRGIGPDEVDTWVVPGSARSDGPAYVEIDEEEAEALFAAFRDGGPFPGAATPGAGGAPADGGGGQPEEPEVIGTRQATVSSGQPTTAADAEAGDEPAGSDGPDGRDARHGSDGTDGAEGTEGFVGADGGQERC